MKINDDDLITQLADIKHWLITEIDGVKAIYKEYRTENFNSALNIANAVSQIADKENHHPQINIKWGSCTIFWWTHDVNGVSDKDIELAKLCDAELG